MSQLSERVGKRVKAARTDLRLTQEEVARQLGVSRAAYANVEIGRNLLGVDHLLKLIRILDRPVEYFLDLPTSQDRVEIGPEIIEKINDIWKATVEKRETPSARKEEGAAKPEIVEEVGWMLEMLPAKRQQAVLNYARYQVEDERLQRIVDNPNFDKSELLNSLEYLFEKAEGGYENNHSPDSPEN